MPDTITLDLSPGVTLVLDHAVAVQAHERLSAALDDQGLTVPLVLDDSHPAWDRHSGGSGHDGPEWRPKDQADAEAFYAHLRGKAKLFYDTLLDRPGRQLSVDDLVTLTNGELKNQFSVAGAINGLRLAYEASGRRYPFYWWEGTPSRYAIKPSVAALFNAARAKAAA